MTLVFGPSYCVNGAGQVRVKEPFHGGHLRSLDPQINQQEALVDDNTDFDYRDAVHEGQV